MGLPTSGVSPSRILLKSFYNSLWSHYLPHLDNRSAAVIARNPKAGAKKKKNGNENRNKGPQGDLLKDLWCDVSVKQKEWEGDAFPHCRHYLGEHIMDSTMSLKAPLSPVYSS